MKARELRRKVIVPARMRAGAGWVDVQIRDISSRGVLIHAATAPSPGAYIEIRRLAHTIIGRTVWTKDGKFGVRTQDRIDVGSILGAKEPGAGFPPERRVEPRRSAASPADQAHRARRFASAFQYAAIGAASMAVAVGVAMEAQRILQTPLHAVAARLAGED